MEGIVDDTERLDVTVIGLEACQAVMGLVEQSRSSASSKTLKRCFSVHSSCTNNAGRPRPELVARRNAEGFRQDALANLPSPAVAHCFWFSPRRKGW